MSVENFFRTYPADKDLKGRLVKEKLPAMSPVATFAAKLARDAGDGLREITRKLSDSGISFKIDQESFQRLPPEDREKMLINHAGVIFGVSIPVLEDCIANSKGTFDLELWCSLYNAAISGTQFSTMKPEKEKIVGELSKDRLQKMRDLVGKDKTFAIFFENNENIIESMPESLKNILAKSIVLPIIQEYILPRYKERAKMLISPSS